MSYEGPARSLVVNGGIEDYVHGFSMTMGFVRPMMGDTSAAGYSIASSGLLSGNQSPMMGFPRGTKFKPFTILRNISDEPIQVKATIEAGDEQTSTPIYLSPILIQPNETVYLPLDKAVDRLLLQPSMINLRMDVLGPRSALLASSGSIDQTGNYVFEVEPQAVSPTETKQIAYWNTSGGNDTMITVWNPSDLTQELILHFKGTNYQHAISLRAHGTVSLSVKELQSAEASKSGFVRFTAGSAWLSSASGISSEINVVLSVGIYNVKTATCGTICPSCLGYVSYWINYDPFSLPDGGTTFQSDVFVMNEAGGIASRSPNSNWSTTNGAIAGSLGGGSFRGNQDGSATIGASLVGMSSDHADCVRGQQCPTETFQDAVGIQVAQVNSWFSDGSFTNALTNPQATGGGNYQVTVSTGAYNTILDFQSTPSILAEPLCPFPTPWCFAINGVQDAVVISIGLASLIGLHNIWVQKRQCPIPYPGNNPNIGPAGWSVGSQNGKPYYESPDKSKSVSPDLDNSVHGPHWDYNDKGTRQKHWRLWPDGEMTPKKDPST